MNNFLFENKTRVYFGKGGGSVSDCCKKLTHEEIFEILKECR